MRHFLSFLICLSVFTFIGCGKDNKNSKNKSVTEQPTVEAEVELVNARQVNDRIFLDSYRYRQFEDYSAGIASVTLPGRSTLSITEEDIKVYVKVRSEDLARVNGLVFKGSEQPWSELKMVSQTSGDVVKLCVQIQPSSQKISNAGLTEVTLSKKKVLTVLGDSRSCVGASANGVDTFDGVLTSYFVVDGGITISAETKSDMKAGNQRVGTQVEFSFTYTSGS